MTSRSSLALLSSSAFGALISIRRYIEINSVVGDEAARALRSISPDFASSNYDAALTLHHRLPHSMSFTSIRADLRHAIFLLVEEDRPWWRGLFPSGRSYVADGLSEDERQVFADAGLFESPPSANTMEWWYRIQAQVRSERGEELSARGGDAELATLAYERVRLRKLGIDRDPELVGFDDNSLGYDVRSFDVGPIEPVARLIEVKSSTADPPRMIIPRGEWEAAKKYGPTMFFYLWRGSPPATLAIIPSNELALHIPADAGDGRWQQAEIVFQDKMALEKFAVPLMNEVRAV